MEIDGDADIVPTDVEQAQSSLASCKAELRKTTGTLGKIWILLEDRSMSDETKAKLQVQSARVEADKDALESKVSKWTSIVRGLTIGSTLRTATKTEDTEASNEIVIQNEGKSMTLTLDAEYLRFLHDSVIKESWPCLQRPTEDSIPTSLLMPYCLSIMSRI